MILETNSIEVFIKNTQRTEMLILAMDKIKAYNRLYQDKAFSESLEYGKKVEEIQNIQLKKIEQSCSEHAMISLATSFETFCKEFISQLLFEFPQFFQGTRTKYSKKVEELISNKIEFNSDYINGYIGLNNRFDYYKFFKSFKITFLTEKENNLIEYIYAKRNFFVHGGNNSKIKTFSKLNNIESPINEIHISTESKKLRTKLNRTIPKIHERIIYFIKSKTN